MVGHSLHHYFNPEVINQVPSPGRHPVKGVFYLDLSVSGARVVWWGLLSRQATLSTWEPLSRL